MKLCWKGRGCSCLVTYGKYLGLAGFLGRWAVLVCASPYWKRFFFFTTFITIIGKQSGSWSESIFFGGVDAAPQCANRTGESGLFFFFCLIFLETCYNAPLWETQRVDLSCLVLLFAALTNTRAPCVTGYSLSVWEKKTNVWLLTLSIFVSICEAFWSGLGGRKAIYEQWSGFAGRVFHRDFSGFFPFILGIALSVLLQLFMGNFGCVGTADPWHPGILYGACVWFRYRGLKAYRTRIYECLNKAQYFAMCDVFLGGNCL